MSEDQITIEINGQSLPARKGQMVIEVADDAGIYIPRFCYHKKLSIAANCRMCLVDVEKAPKPLPACATPVMDGMKVQTKSEMATDAQKGVMEFLLINHPLDCPVCDQGGECELQDLALTYGGDVSRYTEVKRVVFNQNIGPLVSTDMTRCIHCTRCVRFGDEVAGLRELGATGRGEETQIGTYVKKAMVSELSGNIIDICPVGALNNKPYRFGARTWELAQHATVSPHDCVGSNLYLHTLRGEVKRAVPQENETINETWLADRDRFSCHALYSDERITEPQIKEQGKWRTASWEEALAATHTALQKIVDTSGADDIAALISPNATVEEHFLMQKLMRALGSHNIDHRLQQYDFSLDQQAPVFPVLGVKLAELEHVDAALLIASNMRKEQPLASHRLRKAALNGAKIMLANHRGYASNYDIDESLIASPNQLVDDLSAITNALALATNKPVPLGLGEEVSKATVNEQHKRIAEKLINAQQGAVLLGSQASLSPYYAALQSLSFCIAELANASWSELTAGANAAGAWLAGTVPHRLTAGVSVSQPGLSARAMLESPRKAYLLFNVEPELEAWDTAKATSSLEAANTVIVCSAFDSPTLRQYADVILPLATFAETSGTFVNAEGCWQSFAGATKPLGEARPGWKILRVLGNQFDLPEFEYQSSEEVSAAVRQQCADVVSNRVLGKPKSLRNGFSESDATLQRISDVPIYATDALVRRSEPLQKTADGMNADAVLLNKVTASQHDLAAAETVIVNQGGNSIELPLRIEGTIPDGFVWIGLGVPGIEGLGPVFGPVKVSPA